MQVLSESTKHYRFGREEGAAKGGKASRKDWGDWAEQEEQLKVEKPHWT